MLNKLFLSLFKLKEIHILIFILLISNIISEECSKETPYKSSGECVIGCTLSDSCTLDNSIRKSQFPNDLIAVGPINSRYLNFVSFSNNDMLFQVTTIPKSNTRVYYGIKANGRPLFQDNSIKTYIYSNEHNNAKFESGNSIFIMNGKEYFISFGRLDTITEIFDYENKNYLYSKLTKELIGFENNNYLTTVIRVDEPNTYIISGIEESGGKFYPYMIKISSNYDETNIELNVIKSYNNKTINEKDIEGFVPGGSCYKIESMSVIICFYCIKQTDDKTNYMIYAFSLDLELLKSEEYIVDISFKNEIQHFYEHLFFQSIYFRENAGAFIVYYSKYQPQIFFKEYNNDGFKNYFSDIDKVLLEKQEFNAFITTNWLIKISDNKLGFVAPSKDKDIIYIVILFFNFNDSNDSTSIKINYYSIEINNFFRYSILEDLNLHLFNNFLFLGGSLEYSSNYHCELMIIGYPNGTDSYFDITSYLLENNNNNNTINDITLDLSQNLTIDNNIFGYIYDGIKIQNILNDDSKIYLTSVTNNERININDILVKNDKIKINFENNEYTSSNYILYYSFIVTEPEYATFNEYTINEDNINIYVQDFFNAKRQQYIGKEIHFTIDLKVDLTTNCYNINCSLCFASDLSCITTREYQEIPTIQPEETQPTEADSTEPKTNIILEIMDIPKSDLNIKNIINEKEIGKKYEIKGDDFTLKLKPTNSSDFENSTYVKFDDCEKLIRSSYNISNSSIITFLQLELNNDDPQSLINQVEYLAYDDKREIIDISICENIQIVYKLKDNITLDKAAVSSFKDNGIDILDIKDSFFNDLCYPYTVSGKDIILEDRVKDIYQNFSLCDEGCTYNNSDIENGTITCDCEVKQNISLEVKKPNLVESVKSTFKNSNIAVAKCYNLVFSLKDKKKNVGFLVIFALLVLNFFLIIAILIKGFKHIYEYLFNEMVKFDYLKEDFNPFFGDKDISECVIIDEKIDIKEKRKNTKRNNSKKEIKNNSNPNKKKSSKKDKNNKSKKDKTKSKIKKNNFHLENESLDTPDSDNVFSINKTKTIDEKIKNERNNPKERKKTTKLKLSDDDESIDENEIKEKHKSKERKKSSKIIVTDESESIEEEEKHKSKKRKKSSKRKETDSDTMSDDKPEKIDLVNYGIITIDLKNIKKSKPKDSKQTLHNYTYEEAVEYDKRSTTNVLYIYLINKNTILHTFIQDSSLELSPLKLSVFIIMLCTDLAVNTLLYTNDKISKRYNSIKGLFSFTITDNLPSIIISALISYVIVSTISKLTISIGAIRKVFRTEEEKLKKDKKYKIDFKRKIEIFKGVQGALFRYKLKIALFIFIELILQLGYWYYVTAFCAVYHNTQKSWLLDSIFAIISRLVLEFIVAMIFGKIYVVSVDSGIATLYKILICIYDYF